MNVRDAYAIVIGAGAGGLTVALGLARIGRAVALMEADAVGGDCTNVGCIPSKTLLHLSAHLRNEGLAPGSEAWQTRAQAVLAQVRATRDNLRVHETESLEKQANLTLVHGRALLEGNGVVRVGDERWRSRRIVIATGARARTIDITGLPAARTLTNATLFDVQTPPSHLVVVGGGPIGVEMATAFARLGSRVTLVEALPRLLPQSEPEAAALVHASLERLGVTVRTGVRAVAFDEATTRLQLSDGTAVEGVERVLMALGRVPNIDTLADAPGGLEKLGIRLNPHTGIHTDAAHRTTLPGVYAIGDVGERAKFTHAANAQGRRLVRHLTLPWVPLTREGDYPSATFSDPEVAQVGPTLEALQARMPSAAIRSVRVALADLDRALTSGVRDGFVLLHARVLTGRLLGATVVGPNASEIINLLTWAQRRGVSLWQLSRHVVAYPALSEGIKRAADQFVFATLPALPRELSVYLQTRWQTPKRTNGQG
jgi:dihydrolipoamide dehydrogenase